VTGSALDHGLASPGASKVAVEQALSDDGNDVIVLRAAEEAQYHLSAIVQSSDDAIVSKDLDGTVRSWNPGAERLFGYSADEMIGRSIRVIIPAEHQSEEDEVLRRIRNGDRIDHFETVRRRKDGSLVPISLTVSPVLDRRGRVIGASKIARDITEKRAAEELMRSSLALKDQFLGLVSHELRTPISTVVGNAQLLLRRGDRLPTQAREEALLDIATESERLQRIIENLLALTRLEATGEVTSTPVDVSVVAREVIESMRRRNPGREIVLGTADVPDAMADPILISLVIENLVSNALKYSPQGTPIEVLLIHNEQDDPELHVLDRGIGIAREDSERIFEAFYRAASGIANAEGMGLGLAVCRRVVAALGGSIRVEPRAGGGSDFSFSIPGLREIAS
jgi:PAS domain S-box-containing protein